MGLEYSRKRLREYLNLIPANRRELWEPMVDDLAFMETKLSETRDQLKGAGLTVDGGLIPHKNAAFDAYNSLFDRYLRGLQALDSAISAAKQLTAASSWLTRKGPHQRESVRRPSMKARPRPYHAA